MPIGNTLRRLNVVVDADDRASRKLRRVDDAADDAARTMDDGAMAAERFGQQMKYAAITGAAALAYGMGRLVMMGAKLDKTFARISAVTGATDEEMQKIRDTASEIGAEMPVTMSETAKAMKQLSFMGFEVEESIAAANDVVELSVAGMLQMNEAAKITGQALNAFELDADQAHSVTNALAQTTANSATEVQGLGQGLAYVSATANTVGMSVSETVSALGVLSDRGLEASRAGTSLNTSLSKLASGTGTTKKALERMGLTLQDLRDEEGNLRDLDELMRMFNQRFEEMGVRGAERQGFLRDLVGRRGARALAVLIDSADELNTKIGEASRAQIRATIEDFKDLSQAQVDAIDDEQLGFDITTDTDIDSFVKQTHEQLQSGMSEQEVTAGIQAALDVEESVAEGLTQQLTQAEDWRNVADAIESTTTAGDQFQEQMDTVGGKLTFVKGSLQSIGYRIYRGFEPILNSLLGSLMDVLRVIGDYPGVLKAVGVGLFVLTGAIGFATAAWALHYAWSMRVVAAQWALQGASKALTAVIWTLSLPIKALAFAKAAWAAITSGAVVPAIYGLLTAIGPIGWLVMGAAAAFLAWKTNFLGFRDVVEGVIDTLIGLLEWAVGPLIDAAGKFIDLLGIGGSSVTQFGRDADAAGEKIAATGDRAHNAADAFARAGKDAETAASATGEVETKLAAAGNEATAYMAVGEHAGDAAEQTAAVAKETEAASSATVTMTEDAAVFNATVDDSNRIMGSFRDQFELFRRGDPARGFDEASGAARTLRERLMGLHEAATEDIGPKFGLAPGFQWNLAFSLAEDTKPMLEDWAKDVDRALSDFFEAQGLNWLGFTFNPVAHMVAVSKLGQAHRRIIRGWVEDFESGIADWFEDQGLEWLGFSFDLRAHVRTAVALGHATRDDVKRWVAGVERELDSYLESEGLDWLGFSLNPLAHIRTVVALGQAHRDDVKQWADGFAQAVGDWFRRHNLQWLGFTFDPVAGIRTAVVLGQAVYQDLREWLSGVQDAAGDWAERSGATDVEMLLTPQAIFGGVGFELGRQHRRQILAWINGEVKPAVREWFEGQGMEFEGLSLNPLDWMETASGMGTAHRRALKGWFMRHVEDPLAAQVRDMGLSWDGFSLHPVDIGESLFNLSKKRLEDMFAPLDGIKVNLDGITSPLKGVVDWLRRVNEFFTDDGDGTVTASLVNLGNIGISMGGVTGPLKAVEKWLGKVSDYLTGKKDVEALLERLGNIALNMAGVKNPLKTVHGWLGDAKSAAKDAYDAVTRFDGLGLDVSGLKSAFDKLVGWLEDVFTEAKQALKKLTQVEEKDGAQGQQPRTTDRDVTGNCRPGYHWDPERQTCVRNEGAGRSVGRPAGGLKPNAPVGGAPPGTFGRMRAATGALGSVLGAKPNRAGAAKNPLSAAAAATGAGRAGASARERALMSGGAQGASAGDSARLSASADRVQARTNWQWRQRALDFMRLPPAGSGGGGGYTGGTGTGAGTGAGTGTGTGSGSGSPSVNPNYDITINAPEGSAQAIADELDTVLENARVNTIEELERLMEDELNNESGPAAEFGGGSSGSGSGSGADSGGTGGAGGGGTRGNL